MLLGLGVTFSVSGAFNTYIRTGECLCVLTVRRAGSRIACWAAVLGDQGQRALE